MKRVLAATLSVVALVWSCASPEARLGEDVSRAPVFGADASTPEADAQPDAASVLMCVATTCPAPYTTCPSENGPTYACAVDPRSDRKHCGACGNECGTFLPIHMTSRCVDGACELECVSIPRIVHPDTLIPTSYRNCNGLLDDGCEVDLFSDEANCGACGNACEKGQICVQGQCGCPPGLEACNGSCVDKTSRDDNCGACNVFCDPFLPTGCATMPEHTRYGCVASACEKLKCEPYFEDCDKDLSKGCAANGCEVDTRIDPKNCGRCGKACAPDEECREEGFVIACRPKCAATGGTSCPDGCKDILNDPESCGGCNLACPLPGPRQTSLCEKGVCVLACAEGFGDCNGDPTDGCETDLRFHPANCGACGASCDLSAGQPCVEGKCLVAPCVTPGAR